mgnify:CR=1 FL=1
MGFIYRPRHQYQLGPGSGPTGGYDCTAYSAAMSIDRATLGGTLATGRQVRLASSEPVPDRASPGLNLNQVINVAYKWHVDLEQRTGAPWSSVMAALKGGRGVILQGDADQLPPGINGQIGFKGDHAVYVNHVTGDGDLYWMDPLRKAGALEVKEEIARAYAEKFARATGTYPGIRFATTRVTPTIAVAQ